MQINSGYGDAKEERLQRILVDFKFTDYSHETLESVTVNLKDLFEEYGYIPKAKAIPVKWIRQWFAENRFKLYDDNDDIYLVGDIEEMLLDWEKENVKTD